MKLFIVIVTVLIYNLITAQEREASIIFTDNSKVKGIGEIKNDKIYFRASAKDKVEIWSYDITKGIDFDGMGYSELYEYVFCDRYNKPVLMEVLDDGEVMLYKDMVRDIGPGAGLNYSLNNGSLTPKIGIGVSDIHAAYFVKRKDTKKAMELTFSFKSRALKFFADCDIIIEKIKQRIFTVKNIPDLVAYYNNNCYIENP